MCWIFCMCLLCVCYVFVMCLLLLWVFLNVVLVWLRIRRRRRVVVFRVWRRRISTKLGILCLMCLVLIIMKLLMRCFCLRCCVCIMVCVVFKILSFALRTRVSRRIFLLAGASRISLWTRLIFFVFVWFCVMMGCLCVRLFLMVIVGWWFCCNLFWVVCLIIRNLKIVVLNICSNFFYCMLCCLFSMLFCIWCVCLGCCLCGVDFWFWL